MHIRACGDERGKRVTLNFVECIGAGEQIDHHEDIRPRAQQTAISVAPFYGKK